jgi:hypothetical protein
LVRVTIVLRSFAHNLYPVHELRSSSRWRVVATSIVFVQPETVLRWHRAGFRRFWRRRSRLRKTSPLPRETIDLVREMAARGRPWGAGDPVQELAGVLAFGGRRRARF